jgi:dihydrofolate reductase
MIVTMIAVVSLDGCLTRHAGAGASGWASPEDQARYRSLSGACDVQIFGSGTYREHRANFRRSALTGPRKVIVTRNPTAFADDVLAGKLEFTAEAPLALIDRLRTEGHERCGLLGGGQIYGDFLGAGVVDELHLTIEPVVFGRGIRLTGDSVIDVGFRLRDVERLNASTLFLTYDRA